MVIKLGLGFDLIKNEKNSLNKKKSSMHFLHNYTCSKFTIFDVIVLNSFTYKNVKS